MHTEISMFRAVENGCSMLRTTLEGLTMGADYQGRVLSQIDFYNTLNNRTIITEFTGKRSEDNIFPGRRLVRLVLRNSVVFSIASASFNIDLKDLGHRHI